ncbi:MAG: sigma-70 family RNA polymerase sigma factor [Methylomonas sp.]|nr:sigma-70 family RNA polymerase sigma factor [Methylomonas sp.]
MSDVCDAVTQNPEYANSSASLLLAANVEQARSRLFQALLADKRAAKLLLSQLLAELTRGRECSEMLLIKNGDEFRHVMYRLVGECHLHRAVLQPLSSVRQGPLADNPIQRDIFVQLLGTVNLDAIELSSEASQIMRELHFLPAYLIETSERVQNQLGLSGELDVRYKAELQHARLELKRLRQEMIAGNTGLVAFVAHKYRTVFLSFDDLMQEGVVGLIKAVDRFDSGRGICFSTYAIFWIKQAISRLVVKQDKVVPLPVALAEKSSPVFDAMRKTYMQHERWPTLAELKVCCDLSESEIKTISSYYQATFVYESGIAEEDDGMLQMERMQQWLFPQPLAELLEIDLASFMDKVVATLPEKQAHILAMRFGLKNHTEMTLQAVADHLQVTRERVRQIQNEALSKLKQQFGFDLMLFLEPTDI